MEPIVLQPPLRFAQVLRGQFFFPASFFSVKPALIASKRERDDYSTAQTTRYKMVYAIPHKSTWAVQNRD